MYDELIRQFRGKAERCEYDGRPGLARDYTHAANAIDELWTEVKKYRKLRDLWGLKDGGRVMDRVSKAERELVRKIQKQTNADRIRAMTDEELAEWLDNIDTAYEPGTVVSRHGWLYWLRQEATP